MNDIERPWDAPKSRPPTSGTETKWGSRRFWSGLLLAAVIIGLVGWCSAVTKQNMDERNENGDERGAQRACQTFVETRLKSPGSADFSQQVATMANSTKVWTVTGVVDSDNSFGAKIRNGYRCETSLSSGNDWDLESLDLDHN